MATYYVDSQASTGGDGSLATPYTSLSSLTLTNGDVVKLKRNSVFRETLTSATLAANNLTFGDYGDGIKPIITGAELISNWVPIGGNIYSYSLGSNLGGNISENGAPMKWKAWNTNIATTALIPGSFTFDYNTFTYYICPTSGFLNAVYSVSNRLLCVSIATSYDNLTFNNIRFEQASRHGITAYQRTNLTFNNCEFFLMGGYRQGAVHLGNGLEISYGCNDVLVENCIFSYIFDSAGTSQLYEVSANSLERHTWKRNKIKQCGLGGIEVSVQTNNQTIKNIEIRENEIKESAFGGWLSLRSNTSPYAIGIINNGTGSVFAGLLIINNVISDYPVYGIVNTSGTSSLIKGNFIFGPGTTAIRINCTNQIQSNFILGNWTYGVNIVGSTASTVTLLHNIFDGCYDASFRDSTNAFFVSKNNIFINQTHTVHTGNFSGNYTGNNNCVFNNSLLGVSYSSTNDVTTNPILLVHTYYPKGSSPLLTAGLTTLLDTDAQGTAYKNNPTIGPYQYITERPEVTTRGIR